MIFVNYGLFIKEKAIYAQKQPSCVFKVELSHFRHPCEKMPSDTPHPTPPSEVEQILKGLHYLRNSFTFDTVL